MSADGRARLLLNTGIVPEWIGSEIPKRGFIPNCSVKCPSFDGKRCRKIGYEPGAICIPAVERMSEVLDRIETEFR